MPGIDGGSGSVPVWAVVAGAWLTAGAPVLIKLIGGLFTRTRERRTEEQQAEDRQNALDQRQRDALTADQTALFDRLKSEIADLRERSASLEAGRRKLEAERARAMDYAYAWNARAHELRHAQNNLAVVAERVAPGTSLLLPPNPPLPALEDIDLSKP